MTPQQIMRMALDPAVILEAQGLTPDPWQKQFLVGHQRKVLLCCTRGAGKSRATSALALHTALFTPNSLVLILSRAQRQAGELFRYVRQGYSAIGRPIKLAKETETQYEFENGSRVISLPGVEQTVRSLQGVTLLIIDEAAQVADDLYRTVRPMLAVSNGRLIALSTPFGQRGWFWQEWESGADWHKIRVPWTDCPRITAEFIAGEEKSLGRSWVAQEYECSFEAMSGLVYPEFSRCHADTAWPIGKPMDAFMRPLPGPINRANTN
jgi:hypothetical protein